MELAGQPMHPPQHIYGIDFSGGKDSGKNIWIAKKVLQKGKYSVRTAARLKGIRYRGEKYRGRVFTLDKMQMMLLLNTIGAKI
jgi:hypothetical protein